MTWALVFGMAMITYANRYLFFARSIEYHPGARIQRLLSYSSYAVLTAIWTPLVFSYEKGQGVQHAGIDYLLGASVAAILTALRLPSILVVLISTGVFFGLRLCV